MDEAHGKRTKLRTFEAKPAAFGVKLTKFGTKLTTFGVKLAAETIMRDDLWTNAAGERTKPGGH